MASPLLLLGVISIALLCPLAPSHLDFLLVPNVVHCILPGSFQALGFLRQERSFLPTLDSQQTRKSRLKFPFCKQMFLSTYYDVSHAILGVWGYISEQNREKALSLWTHLLSSLRNSHLIPSPRLDQVL